MTMAKINNNGKINDNGKNQIFKENIKCNFENLTIFINPIFLILTLILIFEIDF
ncbi:MAG: hypothetical protein RL494_158 [Bacteroidota bacterium]|jgi:hypothetical protein